MLFIEFIRGVPLIALLFVASTMLNYFLPPGTTFDLLMRVLIMVTLFSAAYIAEVVRGGLQGIPKGQFEAADSLGLSYWKAQRLIILPQALKISIPGIVNTFIGLYKDTTLVLIIGMLDPLGIGRCVARRRGVGRARPRGVPVHRRLLLPVLLRDVALLAVPGAQAAHRSRAQLVVIPRSREPVGRDPVYTDPLRPFPTGRHGPGAPTDFIARQGHRRGDWQGFTTDSGAVLMAKVDQTAGGHGRDAKLDPSESTISPSRACTSGSASSTCSRTSTSRSSAASAS